MPTLVKRTKRKNDFLATALTVAIMICLMLYTTTYDNVPAVRALLSSLLAGFTFILVYVVMLVQRSRGIPLLLALLVFTGITLILDSTGEKQDFEVLLRYVTSISAVFAFQLAPLPDLRRFGAYIGMLVLSYAAVIAATAGSYVYAGTVRATPFWSGIGNSSILVAALILVILLAPLRRLTKIFWAGGGLAILAVYGAVVPVLMIALFLGGWFFLRRGWNRVFLYIFAALATLAGIWWRDNNGVAGADIETLGVGAVGSGRFDSWFSRWHDFTERPFGAQLIGMGPYSDYQVSELWWWEPKNAHSDIITAFMEFGIVGLAVLLFVGFKAYKRSNPLARLALLSIAFGAMASNSLLDRPGVAIGWGFVLYACGYYQPGENRKPKARKVGSYSASTYRDQQLSRITRMQTLVR